MKAKISKRVVEAIEPGPRDVFLWDSEMPGFGCKITPKGRRIYVFQYDKHGKTWRMTIGRHGIDKTAEEARQKARGLWGDLAEGGHPALERKQARSAPTLAEFAERYLEEHARPKKKPRSAAEDERMLRSRILPELGNVRITEITRAELARFHHDMRDTPAMANRCRMLLSKMMNLAEKWGIREDGTNPTRHMENYRELRRERYLSQAELVKLGEALSAAEAEGDNPYAIAAIRLLLLTGARKEEVLGLEWEHVDLETPCLRLPDSKTGAKILPLGAPALEILARLPRVQGNPYVFPGKIEGQRYIAIQKAWLRFRAAATVELLAEHDDAAVADLVADLARRLGRRPTLKECEAAAKKATVELPTALQDVRIHDLRHNFASVGAVLGESLVVIGSILGHREVSTTQRYSHLSSDPRQAGAERISRKVATALKGEFGQVVNLDRGK